LERHPTLDMLKSMEFLGVVLFIFAAGFPPFDDAAEVDLTLHMLQHVLLVFAGVMTAYPHLGRRLLNRGASQWLPRAGFMACALVIVFWHLPGPWDAAVLNPGVHALEHLSFLLVGLLCGSWLLLLTDSGKIGALMAAFFGHMGYAVALISPWNIQVYPLYSLADQTVLGWALLLTGPSLLAGVAYVVARNPEWLRGFSGSAPIVGRRDTFLNKARVPKWVVPVMTGLLAASMVTYFGAVAYALVSTPQASGGGVTVYISETPVTWQYSPQSVKVVLGVNATVTWVSRSISYDTVTDRGGSFNSGTIPPGGTYTFEFTKPGVYEYYCLFHPWMTGTVAVAPGVGQ
jgi:plastocyanin